MERNDEISLGDAIFFFRANWLTIFGTALVCGLAALLIVLLVVPKRFVAAAALVVVPPRFSSQLNPEPFPLQGFQTLLQSDSVIAEAQQRLIEEGVLESKEVLKLGDNIDSQILVSQRREESLSPVIQALARAETPEKAARIANTWANVYLDFTVALVNQATATSLSLLETEYPETEEELGALESQLVELENDYQERQEKLANSWDRRIVAFKKETRDLVTAYRAETRRVMSSALEERMQGLDGRGQRVDRVDDESDRGRTKLLELASVRSELAQTAPTLRLERTVTDESLWQSLILEDLWDEDLSAVRERSLIEQEVNPVFSELVLRAVELETELVGLEIPSSEATAALEALQQERSSGLAKLEEERNLELAMLKRQRQRAVDALEREREAEVEKLDRKIDKVGDLHRKLAVNHNEALLAEAPEDFEIVHLASRAVPVKRVAPRRPGLVSIVATVFGGLLGLFIAMVREVSSQMRTATRSAARESA